MLRLNKETTTKNGEFVTPFLIDGEIVSCFNRAGKTIYKKITDFNLERKVNRRENVVVVSPKLPPTDQLFTEEEEKIAEDNSDNLFIGEKEEKKEENTATEEEPVEIVDAGFSYDENFDADSYI